MTITGGVVSNNTASAEGGGLWNGSGVMTITGVSIESNTAVGASADQGGGGIFNAGGTIEIIRSTVSGNDVSGDGSGGGIHNDANGTVSLMLSTISGNSSNQSGGGIANNGTLNIDASTVTANDASVDGGGFYQLSMENMASASSTIIAGNTAANAGADLAGMGSLSSDGYNLIGIDGSGFFMAMSTDTVGTEMMPVDANLEALADNGGGTMTHAIMCPSPAIDAGDPDNGENDQRGLMVFGDRRDIGAYEYQEECITSTREVFALQQVKIYPNPNYSGQALFLEIPAELADRDIRLNITAMGSGQVLQTQVVRATGTIQVDVNQLPAGMYQLTMLTEASAVSQKLVIIR